MTSTKVDVPASATAAAARAAEIHGQRTVDVFQWFAAERKRTKAQAAADQLAAAQATPQDLGFLF